VRIAITGARGLLGSALIELALRQGHSVLGLDKRGEEEVVPKRLSFEVVDLTLAEQAVRALEGCDAVVHLAAHTSPAGLPAHEVHNDNVVSSYNVLSASAGLGVKRICQASSINAIGASFSRRPRYDYFPLDEQHPTYNEDPYSLSKWICEQQVGSLCRDYPGASIASRRFHMLVPDPGGAASEESSLELHRRFYPEVPLRGELVADASFFDTRKAVRLLSWRDD
jgi:nucleoside-diphosphate-sugar epimerase